MNFLQKIRKTMGDNDGSFGDVAGGNLHESFLFFIGLLLLVSAIDPARLFFNGEIAIWEALFRVFTHSFWWLAGWGIAGPLVAHLALAIMKWEKPLAHTFCAFFYGATPMLLFMWVPWLGMLTPLLSLGNVAVFLKGKNSSLVKPIVAVLAAMNGVVPVMFLGFYLGQV